MNEIPKSVNERVVYKLSWGSLNTFLERLPMLVLGGSGSARCANNEGIS